MMPLPKKLIICCYVALFYSLSVVSALAETIHYRIMQMGVKVGDADLTWVGPVVYKGRDAVLVSFRADGFNFLDEEKIYLDPQAYKPLFVERDLNIFGKKEHIVEEYLTPQGAIKITKTVSGKVEEQILKKDGAVDNIYGFIFRYRQSGSFKVGDVIEVNLPTKDLKIELLKQVNIAAAGTTYNSFYMQSNPAKYRIWFSADEKKLPLRISGAVGIANTVMVMADYKD